MKIHSKCILQQVHNNILDAMTKSWFYLFHFYEDFYCIQKGKDKSWNGCKYVQFFSHKISLILVLFYGRALNILENACRFTILITASLKFELHLYITFIYIYLHIFNKRKCEKYYANDSSAHLILFCGLEKDSCYFAMLKSQSPFSSVIN